MSNKIFVGGIPKGASVGDVKAQLSTYFSAYGSVKHAEVKCDQQGLSRGFGYIEFADAEGTERAMAAYDQHKIGGKWVEVKRYSQSMGRASANACALARMASAVGQHAELPSHLRGSQTPDKATHKDAEALQQLLGAAAMGSGATTPGAMEATALASALYANAALAQQQAVMDGAALAQQQAVMDGAATAQMLASLTNGSSASNAAGVQLLAALAGAGGSGLAATTVNGASVAAPTSAVAGAAHPTAGLGSIASLGNLASLGLGTAGLNATSLGTSGLGASGLSPAGLGAGLVGTQALLQSAGAAALAAAAAGAATPSLSPQVPQSVPALEQRATLPHIPPVAAVTVGSTLASTGLAANQDLAAQLLKAAQQQTLTLPAASPVTDAKTAPALPLAAIAAGLAGGDPQQGRVSQLAAIMAPGQQPAVQTLIQQALSSAGVTDLQAQQPLAGVVEASVATAATAGTTSMPPPATPAGLDASTIQALVAHLGGAGFTQAADPATARQSRAAPY